MPHRPSGWLDQRLLEECTPEERCLIIPHYDGSKKVSFSSLFASQVASWLGSWNKVTDGCWWLEDEAKFGEVKCVNTSGDIITVPTGNGSWVSNPMGYRPFVCIKLNNGVRDRDWEALWADKDSYLDCTGYWKMEKESSGFVPDHGIISARADAILYTNKPGCPIGGSDLLPGDTDYHGYPVVDFNTDV